jgi:hypothetical protein
MCECYLCHNKIINNLTVCHCISCICNHYEIDVEQCKYCNIWYCYKCGETFFDEYISTLEEEYKGIQNMTMHKCNIKNYNFSRCCRSKTCHKKYDEDA